MKLIRNLKLIPVLLMLGLFVSCSKKGVKPGVAKDTIVGQPPATWQEHWFAHTKLLSVTYYDNQIAVYHDDGMDPYIQWDQAQIGNAWKYVKKTYGPYGDSTRLYFVMHGIPPDADADEATYGGGHPAPYYDPSHDYRNTIDCGLSNYTWGSPTGDAIRIPLHEIGHIVASSSYGMTHDLNAGIWGDSKFAEIFIYDVLMNIGRQDEAASVFNQLANAQWTSTDDDSATQNENYPGVDFFHDWFYPIYTKYGKGALLAKYFKEQSDNIDHNRSANLNLGEFVHFYSGAAGVNLTDQAKIAFGEAWDATAEAQLKQAQIDYPGVKYPY